MVAAGRNERNQRDGYEDYQRRVNLKPDRESIYINKERRVYQQLTPPETAEQ
jgi:hypothetical protein